MKTIVMGAAGLLLSGTALAAIDLSKSSAAAPSAVAAKDADGLNGSMIGNAMLIDWPAKAIETGRAFDAKRIAEAAKQVIEPAAAEAPSTAALSETAEETALAADDGVGGPVETVTSYPACAPGPGDDNCIQLYEPGVRQSYAAWQAAALPGAAQTGMGGPDEPVADTGAMPAATADDYPPCRSRSDDRCIQLGERETSLGMGGPEEPADELAAYNNPLPEDLVMPASDELAKAETPTEDTPAL